MDMKSTAYGDVPDRRPELAGGPTVDMLEGRVIAFDVRHLVAIVRGNIWLISLIVSIAVALGLVATLLLTPLYTATATIQINQEADRVLESQDIQPNSNFQDVDRFLQTQINILQSRTLAKRVVQKLRLANDPNFYVGMRAEPAQGSGSEDAAIGLLIGSLTIEIPRDSRVASISFESADPELAARIVNTYADEFIKSNLQRKYDSSNYARAFVSEQLADAKAKLEESERAVNDYARMVGVVRAESLGSSDGGSGSGRSGGGGGQSITVSSLVQLNQAANAARLARIAAEERWRTVQSQPLLSSREVLTNSAVQGLVSQRAAAVTELRREQTRYLADHPVVMRLNAQISEIDKQIASIGKDVRATIKSEYDTAIAQERTYQDQVSRAKADTLTEQDQSVRYNTLDREAQTNRTLYDGLLQRYKELTAAAGISSSNVSVIDLAIPPKSPSSPKLWLNLIIALLGGVALAILVVFVREQLDDAIRMPEDVEAKIGLPLLGVIPIPEGDTSIEEDLRSPRSAVSEAYNALRGLLLYATPDGLPKVILVTSTQSTEGKSTTSTSIARGLAKVGKKIALIDVDMRRPSIHSIFDMPNEHGLSDYLTGNAEWPAVMRETDIPNLSMMTAGPIPASPTELLSSQRMISLLNALRQDYDAVILDAPPVLGLGDAPLLSKLAEETIYVIESERGRRGRTFAALRRLRASGGHLLGAVLTKFNGSKSRNAYTYYYNYEYYDYGN